jgi:hypothetical protein
MVEVVVLLLLGGSTVAERSVKEGTWTGQTVTSGALTSTSTSSFVDWKVLNPFNARDEKSLVKVVLASAYSRCR